MGFISDIFGGGQAKAAKQAAKIQADAALAGNKLIKEQFDITRGDLAPYRTAGLPALSSYQDFLGLNGAAGGQRFLDMFQQNSPGFQFGLDQGERAINNNRAVRGLYGSGSAAKALSNWGTDYANQQIGNYANRFLGLAEMGQNAAAQTGSFGAAAAQAQANGLADAGNATAAGIIGAAQARANGWGQLLGLGGAITSFGSSGGRNWFGLNG